MEMRSVASPSQNTVAELPVSQATAEAVYIFPPSFGQQQLWLLDRLLADGSVYNVPAVVRLVGALQIEALQAALLELVRRHEVLRTRFEIEDAMPVQVIAPEFKFGLEVDDLSAVPTREREAEAQRRTREAAAQPFDLERGPLLRARLLRLGESEHWLLLTLHHIVTDGWSSGVLWRELSVLYEAFREGRPSPLPELAVQYADYAVWQREWLRGEVLEEQLSYWKKALADLPVLELPTDRPRPAVASYRGGRLGFELGEDLTRGLKELGRREGATLFMTLLAAFQVLWYRYSGQEDVAVGVPLAGRRRPELEGLIGFFVNMLVLRGDLSGQPSFKDHLARVRTRALAAYAHQDMPFAKLVEELAPTRNLSRNPLFQVCFALENTPPGELQLPGLEVQVIKGIRDPTAKFDLHFFVAEEQEKINVVVEYATDLFDASTIERIAGHWRVLLDGIVADPTQKISRLPLLTAAEREQLLGQGNATATAYPRDTCIHELFEAQVRRTPEATAVVFEEQRLTYAELNARANQLAHHLRTLGVGPEVLVALAMERSLELVVGLLGILKAGGAYVPLDPSYPAERLAFMLADTQAPVLLTQQRLLGQLPAHAGRTLCLHRDWPSIAVQPTSNPTPGVTPDNLAYVIYTSGSTGTPKGTLVTHHNIVRLFAASEPWFGFDEHDVWTGFHSFAFDFSVWEMWGALICGGRLVLVPYLVSRDPKEFHALLVRERVTVLNQTPSAFRQLMDVDAREHASENLALRFVILGGELLDVASLRPWFERHGDVKPQLVNMYGITETTVHVTYRPIAIADLDAASGSMIGEPISDLNILLLDSYLQPVPVGIPGEIFVGGAGVARGYLNRPEMTAERFIANPYSTDPTSRLYRSGDLARRTADNDLAYLGRIDLQVKIRGFRIELGEVEAVLKQHKAIRDAVVLASEDRPGDKRLAAYVVPAQGRPVIVAELRGFLLSRLPDYMVPSAFVTLEALPLTANGKVDRTLLSVSEAEFELAKQAHVSPRNAVEVQLMRIWEQILDVSPIGMQDNFFALGGDSLAAVRLIDRVEQLFGRQLPPDMLWYREGTIESLARALVDDRGPPLWSGPVPIKATGKRRPLFCPHVVGGHLFFYDNLARHLAQDQPLYGLPARGLDGKAPADTRIEAMAAHCIHSMQQAQPRGPYRLAGYCSGGAIAFEMARQLHAQGDTVELLALCDSVAPGFRPMELARTTWNFLRVKNVRLVQQRLYRFVLQNLGLSRLRKFRTVTEAHYWAHLSYRPRPYPGRAILFRGSYTYNSHSPSLGWARLATAGVDICIIPCGHSAMVKEPTVRVLAARLETYLSRVAQGSRDQETGPVLLDS
jgi:amino acid adenylation domain-containing protein